MKNINSKEFEINKTTMRDLTPYEVDQVGGGSLSIICPIPITITITITITTTVVEIEK